MRYSVLFVAVLILVSGFIAYFGDMLGRWMGKKRLTLLSLRPRHTAYIVTAITGMLISALALLALVSANLQFKKVLTEGEQILEQNASLRNTKVSLTAANKSLEARRKELLVQVDRQRKEVEEAQDDALKAAAAQVKAAEAEAKAVKTVERLKRDIDARQRELGRLTRERAAALADVQAKTHELAQLKLRLKTLQVEADRARYNAALAKQQHAEAQQRLEQTTAKLKQAEALLAEQQRAIAEQKEQLRLQQAALVKTGLEKEEYRLRANELLGGDIRFRQSDEITRGTISPRQSVFGIRGDLFSLLDTASENALKHGAGVGSNGRSVMVEFQQPITRDYAVRLENESACVQMAAEAIAQSAVQPFGALVQVLCARNSLAGEQVRVRLVLYYNNLVFRKGGKIAETRMDGRVSEGRVLLALVSFLQNELSRAATGAGIVPVANPDPRTSLGSDPRTQVEALMAVVDQIKSKNSRVDVEAYTSADIYAAGPLNMTNMRFSVSKIE